MKIVIRDKVIYRDDGTTIPLRSNVKFISADIVDDQEKDTTEITVTDE